MLQQTANIIMILVMLLGVLLVPLSLPGNWIIVAASILYGFFFSFDQGQTSFFWVVGILIFLAALGELIEFVVGLLGSKPLKVSNGAIISAFFGGILGAIIGVPIFLIGTLLGIFLGSFLGAFIYEWIVLKEAKKAAINALAVLASKIVASFYKTVIGCVMSLYLLFKIY